MKQGPQINEAHSLMTHLSELLVPPCGQESSCHSVSALERSTEDVVTAATVAQVQGAELTFFGGEDVSQVLTRQFCSDYIQQKYFAALITQKYIVLAEISWCIVTITYQDTTAGYDSAVFKGNEAEQARTQFS